MERKDIAYSDVSRSLNRLEGFIDDFLSTVQSYKEKRIIEKINVIVDGHKETMVINPIEIKKSIIGFIDDVKFNRDGDESINYFGIHDCVDYILNNQSLLLAKRAFSIETKINEAENILISFIADIKEASDLLWETGQILWQIGELHIEPFIQCGDGDDGGDGDSGDDDINTLPPDMKDIFNSLDDYKTFINDCRNLHKQRQIVSRLLDVPNLSLDYGNIDTLHKHLKNKGIINLEYSSFCRVIREELKA